MAKRNKQTIKKTGRARKEQIVAELLEKIDGSTGLVFADYQGLTHQQLESLKKELKQLDSTIVIAKNSLFKISIEKSKNYADFKDNEGLNQPTAALIMKGDIVEPLKKLQRSVKDFGLPKIKFGILEGQALDEAQVLKIASLPNRDTLIAQFVGMLNSPIQGLVVTLNGTIQNFVMTLNAIAQNKPASPASAVAEAPAEQPASQEPAATEATNDTPSTKAEAETSAPEAKTEDSLNETAPETEATEDKTEEDKGGEN